MDSDFVLSFLTQGIKHVLTGLDHMLFAIGLVIALTGFWEVFKIIGLFTIAHSISVVVTAWHGRQLVSPSIVEPAIGASIILIAVENILLNQDRFTVRRATLVFLLGLIHGMAFGNELLSKLVGIPGNAAAWAVGAFCVGVEAGHLCLVAPLSGVLKIGRDACGETFRRHSLKWGSMLVALGGCYYFAVALYKALTGGEQ